MTSITSAPEKSAVNEATIRQRANELVEAAKRAIINSAETMEKGADMSKLLKSLAKKIEEMRTTKVKPLNDEVSAINANFKAIINPLSEAAKGVESKMLAYTKEQEEIARKEAEKRRIQEEEERRISAEAAMVIDENGNLYQEEMVIQEVAPVLAVAVPTLTRSSRGAVAGIRKTWTYEVIDILALATHRPDLIETISVKINAEIRGENGKREIPGLKIFQQEAMNVR